MAISTDIGRAMHRHHTLHRQQVIENAEHRLLHFARIGSAADQDQLLGEVYRNHRLAVAAMALGIRAEAGEIDDCVFGHEIGELGRGWANQQRAYKQVVPCQLVDHADIDPVAGLATAKQIRDIQRIPAAQRRNEIGLQRGKMLWRHRCVGLAPPHGIFGLFIADDEFILGGTPGASACCYDQRPVCCEDALAIPYGVLNKRRCA